MKHFYLLFKTSLCCITSIFIIETIHAQTIYVTPLGAGDQSGSTWADAAPGTQLQNKINNAANGSEIWVAEGTYYPNTYPEGCTSCSVPRNYTFQLRNGISVYGGFAGTETSTGQRTIPQHSTILSGDIGAIGDIADNAFHIVLSLNNDATARLDGFIVTKGKADGSSTIYIPGSSGIESRSGAGYYGYQSSPAIANCTFTANAAMQDGAGMYNYFGSSPVLTDCNFSANTSTYGKGGGLSNEYSCLPVVKRCSFQNNSAYDGAGVYNINSSPAFTDCSFSGNIAVSSGSSGGGVDNFNSPATFTGCSFTGNRALRGGGMNNHYRSSIIVTNCMFAGNSNNYGGEGGGISNSTESSLTITGSSFLNNTGGNNGGGIYNYSSSLTATNCVFAGNSALFSGGAFYSSSYASSRISVNVTNCTFYGNKTTDNSGAFGAGGAIYNGNYADLFVSNSIIWGNTGKVPGIYFIKAPVVSFSNVQEGYDGQGNINADPLFVDASDPDGADNIFGTEDDGLALNDPSPAINSGDNDAIAGTITDVTGNSRILHSAVDMGAYESPYDAPLTPWVSITANPGVKVCAGTTVTFTARPVNGGASPTYQWKRNGDVVGESNAAYSTSELADGDVISVKMTSSESNVSSTTAADNLTVIVNEVPGKPIITANGATTFCSGGSVLLGAPEGYASYKWSNSETTQSIMVHQSGSYSIIVTNESGCTSIASDAVLITENAIPLAPIVTVTNNCGTSTLSTTATGTLLWSTEATTPSITVSNAGSYAVTQSVNGCTSDAGSLTVVPKAIPSAPIVTVVNNCGSSTLSTTSTGTLLWNTGATTSSITVSSAQNCTVTQTVNGCTSDEGSATSAPGTPPVTPLVMVINNCGNAILSIPAGGTILWSNGATTPSITVTSAGTYKVTRTLNGCKSAEGSGTAAPKALPATPVVSLLNGCSATILSTTAPGRLLWSTGAATPIIAVTAAGTYTVTQTVNGCSSAPGSGTAAPKALPGKPSVTVTNNCGSSVLSTTATGALLWSTGAKTPSITVSAPGVYSVIQTANGCISLPGVAATAPNRGVSLTANNVSVNTTVNTNNASVALDLNITATGTPTPTIVYKIGNKVITSPYIFSVGPTTVSVTATNSCGTVTKTFVVTIKDNQRPSITCKPGATKTVSGTAYTISGTEFNPAASDNCGTPSMIYCLSGATSAAYKSTNTSLAGVKLNIGTTTVTWQATDASGNMSTCATAIKVSKTNAYSRTDTTTTNEKDKRILEEAPTLTVKVAPNPSSNYFTLQLTSGSNEKCTLIVVDMSGKLIERRDNVSANGSIQLGSSYLSGTYIAQVLQGNERVSLKLIKLWN